MQDSDTWYEIENFPRYNISIQGEVFDTKLGRLLKPQTNSTGVKYVALRSPWGRVQRSVNALLKDCLNADNGDEEHIWKAVVGFPDYEINDLGAVRNKKTKRRLTLNQSKRNRFYNLRHNGRTRSIAQSQLLLNNFPYGDEQPYLEEDTEEWRRIARYPLYEMTADGDIRWIATKEVVRDGRFNGETVVLVMGGLERVASVRTLMMATYREAV